MTNVVGLFGAAGSGKSAAADAFEDMGFQRIRFSGPLKDMMRGFFRSCGLSDVEIERRIEGDLKETPDDLLGGKTPRYAMQTLGTEWGRDMISKDIWSKAWRSRAEREIAVGRRVVAEDVRFETEEAEVRRLNGKLVKVVGRSKESVATGGHASEAMSGLKADIECDNTGSLDALNTWVRYVFGGAQEHECAA